MKFEVFFNDNQGKFFFHLKAKNGQIILASQGYAAKPNCLKGIESVKTNVSDDSKFQVLESQDGKHYFNLLAANKQIIGTSQMYKGMDGVQKGISSVKENAPAAEVADMTTA